MVQVISRTSFFVVLLMLSGCQLTSKYALDDADYAAKYDVPYEDGKIVRMGKQMVDARHVAGKGGVSFGVGLANTGGGAIAGDLGVFGYQAPWLEVRGGLAGVYSGDAEDGFLGGHVGMRVHPPSRLAPFAGVGAYVGLSDDGDLDDCHCEEDPEAFVAAYPEIGVHYWLSGRSRVSISSQYWVNSQGRAADFWLHTISYSILSK